MFTNRLKQYAKEEFEKRIPKMNGIGEMIQERIYQYPLEEQILLHYLYGTMPLHDAGEYEFEVILSYVKHALFLREQMPWCAALPEDIFILYVLYYRINTEDITDCRAFFYHLVIDLVKDLTMKEAALEINYWCADHAAYEASDNRTISPVTVYKSGRGRCGEESTFTVSVLRSVGIPARQVYTPRWAHCDDNHAWVEVWMEDGWHFLGACEPEEVLDKGWFLNASSRALFVYSRRFGSWPSDSQPSKGQLHNCAQLVHYDFSTPLYANTKELTIVVKDKEGNPQEGAEISLEILNMAEFHRAITIVTGEDKKAGIRMGCGDIRIHAKKGTLFGDADCTLLLDDISKADPQEYSVILDQDYTKKDWLKDKWEEVLVRAPKDCVIHRPVLTQMQKEKNKLRLRSAMLHRGEREAEWKNFINESNMNQITAGMNCDEIEKIKNILCLAKGNVGEILKFMNGTQNAEKLMLLCTLTKKDYKDCTKEVLEEHLEYARFYQDEEGYAEYILCPRVYTEELTCYRKYISSYFTDSQKVKFRNDPTQILGWIEENITYEEELEYEALAATPVCCLKLLKASPLSRGILFVAICRTLGIAARLNPASLEAQYYKNGNFTEAKQDRKKIMITGVLKLFTEDLGKIKYFQNITIGRLQGDQFITLDYENITWNKSPMEFHLPKGVYRLLVSSRMPGGDQMLSQRCFALEAGEVKEITVQLKCAALKDQLVSYELNDFTLENKEGKRELLSKIIQDKTSILCFLEEGKEPTEHVLNELLERAGEITLLPAKIIFIVNHKSSLKNETLALAVKKIPAVEIYFDDFSENVEAIARRMYVDPEKMPLLTIVQPNLTGIYASSGYNVGSVDLMMKLVSLGSTGN